MRCRLFVVSIFISLSFAAAQAAPQPDSLKVKWLEICPGCPNNPFGITGNGVIAGTVSTPQGERGFLLTRTGQLTYVDTPGNFFIELQRGNNRGQVTGAYFSPSDSKVHGFVREKDGSLREITYPGAPITVASSINEQGEVLGSYTQDVTLAQGWISFIERKGQITELIKYPDPRANATIALGFNQGGDLVGVFELEGSVALHGFYRNREGSWFEIAFPAASEVYLSDINEEGIAVGNWRDWSGVYHGLVYSQGLCYTVDPGPSPSGYKNTTLTGINNEGQLVGVSFAAFPGDGDGFLITNALHGSDAKLLGAGVACAVPYPQ